MAMGNHGSKKPAPFSRPSVGLDRHNKSWQTVPLERLCPGDVIEGRGTVESVQLVEDGGHIVQFLSRDVRRYAYGASVRAFTLTPHDQ